MATEPHRTTGDKAKGIVHICIGIIYIGIGILTIYANNHGFIEVQPTFSYIMCGLFSIYGLFRIYRGFLRVKGKAIGW